MHINTSMSGHINLTSMPLNGGRINTENVFRDKELDVGFILRANEEVAKLLKGAINDKGETMAQSVQDLDLALYDPSKRCYGLTIDNKLYLCSLVDLPCIIEAQKTLDYTTFYKSCDASQMMYVHNVSLENLSQRTSEEIAKFVDSFNPLLHDEEFFQNLYQRKLLKARLDAWEKDERVPKKPLKLDDLKFRHGLSPGAQNIRNVRHKVEPIVDVDKVHQVEMILKSLIETGFADNCDEELLEFDEEGKLVNTIPGVTEDQRQTQADAVFKYKDGYTGSELDGASVSQSQSRVRMPNRSAMQSEVNHELMSESATNICATPSKQMQLAANQPQNLFDGGQNKEIEPYAGNDGALQQGFNMSNKMEHIEPNQAAQDQIMIDTAAQQTNQEELPQTFEAYKGLSKEYKATKKQLKKATRAGNQDEMERLQNMKDMMQAMIKACERSHPDWSGLKKAQKKEKQMAQGQM